MSNPDAFSPSSAATARLATLGLWLAITIAALATVAVGIEGTSSLRRSLGDGRSLVAALLLFLRYFTILTNIAAATLMVATVIRRDRGLPAGIYAAVTVYAAVTGIVYEVMLRRLWHPQGVQFLTDVTMHDTVPALVVIHWVLFAPKRDLRRRDAAWLLVFPAAYFTTTLLAGAQGVDYPYSFLDVTRLGYTVVFETAGTLLALFYALGLVLCGAARLMCRNPG